LIRALYIGPLSGIRGGAILGNNLIRSTSGRIFWTHLDNMIGLTKQTLLSYNIVYVWSGVLVQQIRQLSSIPIIWHQITEIREPESNIGCGATRVIVLSEDLKLNDKFVVLENPIPEKFTPGSKDPTLSREHPVVIYCGLLHQSKGTDLLIQAVDGVPCELWLVGHDTNIFTQNIKNVKRWGVQADPLKFYRSANMFILPSFSEGMSLSLLEAMAVGLPCIASDIPANRATLRNAGMYCELNSSSIRESILKLIESEPLRKELSTKAIQISETRRLKPWSDRIVEIIKQTL
jgi:glycosyltransferase involved in cell wall biosynthesis